MNHTSFEIWIQRSFLGQLSQGNSLARSLLFVLLEGEKLAVVTETEMSPFVAPILEADEAFFGFCCYGSSKPFPANWTFSAHGFIGATACTPPQFEQVPK